MLDNTKIKKNLTILNEMGIRGPKANQLAILEHVDERFIKEHVYQALEVEGQSLGLAIWRIEHNKEIRGSNHGRYTFND